MTKEHFRVTGKITKLLGREALSNDVEALQEILRNCHDADALSATVNFDFSKAKTIRITEERGDGMTYDEIVNNFLVIGTYAKQPKRASDIRKTKRLKRTMIGKKGVGRFALEKLGHSVKLVSKPINSRKKFTFEIDWDQFEGKSITVDQIGITIKEDTRSSSKDSGLEIEIRNLRSDWDKDMITEFTEKIKSLVLPKQLQPRNAFNLFCESTFHGIPKTQIIPELHKRSFYTLHAKLRENKIIVECKKTGRNYITKPYTKLESFTENKDKKVSELTCGPAELEVYYFPEWSKSDKGILKANYWQKARDYYGEDFHNNIKKIMESYHGVRIHQDGVRLFKYGDPGYDWVERALLSRRTSGAVQAERLIGYCHISSKANPDIVPTINRTEAEDNQAFRDLKDFVIFAMRRLDTEINNDRRKLFAKYKEQTSASIDNLKKVQKLVSKSNIAKALKKIETETGEDLSEVQPILKSAIGVLEDQKKSDESDRNIDLIDLVEASLGEWVSRLYHDHVDTASASLFLNFEKLVKFKKGSSFEKTIGLELQKIIDKFDKDLDRMSYFFTGIDSFTEGLATEEFWKKHLEKIKLSDEVDQIFDATSELLEINEDEMTLDNAISKNLELKIYKPVIFSILYNIISNSMKALKNSRNTRGNRIHIKITLARNDFSIFFSDNATKGLSPKDDFLFEKRISRTAAGGQGKGLGLFILKQMLLLLDGTIKIIPPQFGSGTTLKITLPKKFIWQG